MPNYPDIETLLAAWLVDWLGAGPASPTLRRVVSELPDDLFGGNATPCAVIERFGGYDTIPGLDIARVNIDVYCLGPDPLQAREAALARGEDIRRAIRLNLTGRTLGLGGPVVSKTVVMSAPTIRPYDSRRQVRRSQAAYELRLHHPI